MNSLSDYAVFHNVEFLFLASRNMRMKVQDTKVQVGMVVVTFSLRELIRIAIAFSFLHFRVRFASCARKPSKSDRI